MKRVVSNSKLSCLPEQLAYNFTQTMRERSCSFYMLSTVTYFSPYFWPTSCCHVFFFHSGSNTICDLVLHLLYEILNISFIYDGTIPFQYLKILVTMQDSAFSETGSQFNFHRYIAPMWKQAGKELPRACVSDS